jgi:membrane-bound lytic murein transglycosylase D
VKSCLTILLLLFVSGAVIARPDQPSPSARQDGGLQSLDEWMQENIDDDVLHALKQMDQDRVRQAFTELQLALQGTNIYQLTALKETAAIWMPVLKGYEETYPLGAWLETHLDYLDAAEKMQARMKETEPAPKPGTNALPTAPSLKIQRQVWVEELKQRPWPPLAKSYVPQLKKIFLAEQVPTELVWLAEVESSFDPKARSPAGAAGMFQLMPDTARDQNLSLFPFDQRLQPEKSAHAAACELRRLHKHFGDWQLALAAYNVGQGRLDKLLKKHNAHTFDAIARRLPVETQMYVPKIEATMRKREGMALADLK